MKSVDIMGQTIHRALLTLVAQAPPPPLCFHLYDRDLESILESSFIHGEQKGYRGTQYKNIEAAWYIWTCFTRLQLLSPNHSSVDRLIFAKCLGIYVSSGFIKNLCFH